MPHDGAVEVEQRRDQKTVAIGTALVIFVLVVVGGAIMLWLAGLLGLGDGLSRPDQLPLCAVGVLVMVTYLARFRGR